MHKKGEGIWQQLWKWWAGVNGWVNICLILHEILLNICLFNSIRLTHLSQCSNFQPTGNLRNCRSGFLKFSRVRKLNWHIGSKWVHVLLYIWKYRVPCWLLVITFAKKGGSGMNWGNSFFIEHHKLLGDGWGRNKFKWMVNFAKVEVYLQLWTKYCRQIHKIK